MDRADLAVDALLWAGNTADAHAALSAGLATAQPPAAAHWDELGDSWAQHGQRAQAMSCYAQSRNTAKLAACMAAEGDVAGLERLSGVVTEAPLAATVGWWLQLAGRCDGAVQAYLQVLTMGATCMWTSCMLNAGSQGAGCRAVLHHVAAVGQGRGALRRT